MEMTKGELKRLYSEKTNKEVCEILGISQPTLVRYIEEAGIPLKGKGGGFTSRKLVLVG